MWAMPCFQERVFKQQYREGGPKQILVISYWKKSSELGRQSQVKFAGESTGKEWVVWVSKHTHTHIHTPQKVSFKYSGECMWEKFPI